MIGPNVADGAVVLAFLFGCSSEPRTSPWPKLGVYLERPDIGARIASIDREAAASGLTLVREVETKSETGTRYVVRAYVGRDSLGRDAWACRVASPYGVVMAVGPATADGPAPHEVVFEADRGAGRLFVSPGQLVRGGEPELLLRNAAGELAVWTLAPLGASEMPIELSPPPIRVIDLPTGELGLAAEIEVPPAREPRLTVTIVASEDGGRFTPDAPAALAFHAAERERAALVPEEETADARLDRRTKEAFHAIRAGAKAKDVASRFAKEDAPAELRSTSKERAAWLEKQRAPRHARKTEKPDQLPPAPPPPAAPPP
jgi:hypothetical protein